MRRTVAVAVTMGLVLTACGGSAESELVDAFADVVYEDASAPDSGFEVSRSEARCVAEAFVGGVGADRLTDAGLTPDAIRNRSMDDLTGGELDLSEADYRYLVDGVFDCVDMESQLAESMAEDGTLSASSARCLASGMIEAPEMRGLMARALVAGDDAFDSASDQEASALMGLLFSLAADCLDESEFASLMGG